MEAIIRKHLGWKERQLLTPMWIGFAAIFLLSLVVTVVFSQGTNQMQDFGVILVSLLVLFGCTFGLAVGIFMFSPEREQGTDQFLSSFPVSGRLVSQVKLRNGAVYFLSFLGFLTVAILAVDLLVQREWLFAELLRKNQTRGVANTISLFVIPVECYLWSLLCSQLFSRALVATIAAAFASVIGLMSASLITESLGIRFSEEQLPFAFLAARVVMASLLAVAVVQVGKRWLRGNAIEEVEGGFVKSIRSLVGGRRTPAAVSYSAANTDVRSKRVFQVLVWQTLRQHWMLLVGVSFASVLFGAYWLWELAAFRSNFGYESYDSDIRACLIFAGAIGAIVGMHVFAFDQVKRSFLFFQQQGEYPFKLWAARMMLVLAAGLIVSVAIAVPVFVFQSMIMSNSEQPYWWVTVEFLNNSQVGILRILLVYVGCAAIGQFCSIMIRSSILMVAAAFSACAIGGVWLSYLVLLGVSPWWFGWPIPAAFLAATCWYAPRWISGQRPLTSVVIPSVFVMLVIAGTILGLRHHRLNDIEITTSIVPLEKRMEIYQQLKSGKGLEGERYRAPKLYLEALSIQKPLLDVAASAGLSHDELVRPDLQFGIQYNQTRRNEIDFGALSDELIAAYVNANLNAYELAVEATKQPDCYLFLSPTSNSERKTQQQSIWRLLNVAAEYRLTQGQHDLALEAIFAELQASRHLGLDRGYFREIARDLVLWAEMPAQTSARIQKALTDLTREQQRFLEQENRSADVSYLSFLEWYGDWTQGRQPAKGLGNFLRYRGEKLWEVDLAALPWEIERSKIYIEEELVESSKKTARTIAGIQNQKSFVTGAWIHDNTYYLQRPEHRDPTVLFVPITGRTLNSALMELQTFRYVRVRWALAAWKLDHGEHPAKLAELEPDYLKQLPVDVFLGGNFHYAPKGIEVDAVVDGSVDYGRGAFRKEVRGFIPPETPFLLPWFIASKEEISFRVIDEDYSDEERDFEVRTGVNLDNHAAQFRLWWGKGGEEYILKQD